jgi:hypothetical protein
MILPAFGITTPVEIAQRGQAMRDGDHLASAHQAAKRLADRFLGFAVERSGGFRIGASFLRTRAMAMRYYRPRCLMQNQRCIREVFFNCIGQSLIGRRQIP